MQNSTIQIEIPPSDKTAAGMLQIQRVGSGRPLLLVHGFPLSSRMWQNQIEALHDQFEMFVPDLRGFGQSSRLECGWTIGDFACDLESMIDAIEIESVVLCGLSLGGYIALEFWNRFPHRVSGLVLCNTRASADDDINVRGRRMMAQRVRKEGTSFVQEAMKPKLLAEKNLNKNMKPDVDRFFAEADAESIAITQLAIGSRIDFTAQLSEINLATTVIAGEHDVITPAADMEAMANRIPNSNFEIVEGAGHLTPIENPIRFNQILRSLG